MPGEPETGPEALDATGWARRERPLRGREVRLEVASTAALLGGVAALVALGPAPLEVTPALVALVVAYAVAGQAEFPVGTGSAVPTQLFLVGLFALAPAALVPLLVFAALLLGGLAAMLAGRGRADRLVLCGGDALHALGPALVLVLLADGRLADASASVLLLALAAQLVADLGSTCGRDALGLGVRPRLQAGPLARVWAVDLALTPFGLLAAHAAEQRSWAALAPLPLVALLAALAADRRRRIARAHERTLELEHERQRFRRAVRRTGDALGAKGDLDALVDVTLQSAVEALDARCGRGRTFGRTVRTPARLAVGEPEPLTAELFERAEEMATLGPAGQGESARGGVHALAQLVGRAPDCRGILAVARAAPWSDEERALLGYLAEQAAVAADNAVQQRLLAAAEARLRHQAFHDGLTGLANRLLLTDRVEHALERQRRTGDAVALLVIDLDGFKAVNDERGHEAGDEALGLVARRIERCLRDVDTAARLGGDEFVVLLEQPEDAVHAEAVGARLADEISAPLCVDGRDHVLSASVGVAMARPGLSVGELLRRADLAMYVAKQEGGHRVRAFHADMLTRAEVRAALAQDLGAAVGRREFELRFQPVLDLAASRVWGVEALVRWRHPEHGLLAPDEFLALADEAGVMPELGLLVLEGACRTAAAWPDDAEHDVRLIVNVAPAQLRDESFPETVAEILRRHGLPARRLVLEITAADGHELGRDVQIAATLAALRRLGVVLALDGFGRSSGSLGALADLPIELLTLDRELIRALDEEPARAQLVGGLLRLARALGIDVVVAGIERQGQLDAVLALGGTLGQGFLLGVPLEGEALGARLAVLGQAAEAVTVEALRRSPTGADLPIGPG